MAVRPAAPRLELRLNGILKGVGSSVVKANYDIYGQDQDPITVSFFRTYEVAVDSTDLYGINSTVTDPSTVSNLQDCIRCTVLFRDKTKSNPSYIGMRTARICERVCMVVAVAVIALNAVLRAFESGAGVFGELSMADNISCSHHDRLLRVPATDLSTEAHPENCIGPCTGDCAVGVPRLAAQVAYKHAVSHTMLNDQRLRANVAAVVYVSVNNLRGDIVEAGVAHGGSAALLALTAARLGGVPRRLHLYDTFAGLPQAIEAIDGTRAMEWTGKIAFSLKTVKSFVEGQCGLRNSSITYHVGRVEETLQSTPPPCEIAILRIDTDWYESHVHLFKELYPRVVPGGAIIVDDYYVWPGSKRAVDEWLAIPAHSAPLVKIDNNGVMWCKPGGATPCDLAHWEVLSGT
jgi:O-methyltransferase